MISTSRKIVVAPRRHWCFTLNNPTEYYATSVIFSEQVVAACGHRFRYLVFQEETGESGTPHYQGYLELNGTTRLTWLKKNVSAEAHWEHRKGTREQARDYCMKDEGRTNGPWVEGDFNKGGQGKRNDLTGVINLAKTGASAEDIAQSFPILWIKFNKGIRSYMDIIAPARTEPPTIILCYGPTGTGKTKWAYDTHTKLFRKPCGNKWFDGYSGGNVILLDDFFGAASKMSLPYLLQLLDRYPIRVEVKGGSCMVLATTIVITSNYHPRKWYTWDDREESYRALARRIHTIYYFAEFGTPPMECSHDFFFCNYETGYSADAFCCEKTQEIDFDSQSHSQDPICPETPTAHQPSLDSDDEEAQKDCYIISSSEMNYCK